MIVVGTDGSSESLRAVTWAAREAARQGVPLRLVHALPTWAAVSPPGSRHPEVGQWWRTEARRVLRQSVAHAEREAPAVVLRSAVLPGDPAPVLLAEARAARMLVVGGHGLGGIRGLLLGSVGLKLAGHTPCPLVVVRGAAGSGHDEILVGVDASAGSAAALEFAFAEASLRGAAIRAVYAWEPPLPPVVLGAPTPAIDLTGYAQDAARVLADALEPVRQRHPEVKVTTAAVCGHPVRVLEEASAAADLLVVGARGLGGLSGLILGSVSHGVLHRAHCSVAVVRG